MLYAAVTWLLRQDSWLYYTVPVALSIFAYYFVSNSGLDYKAKPTVIIADILLIWFVWGVIGTGFQLYNSHRFKKLIEPLKQGKYGFQENKLLDGFLSKTLRTSVPAGTIRLRISDDFGKFIVRCRYPFNDEVEWEFNGDDDVTTMTGSIYAYLDAQANR